MRESFQPERKENIMHHTVVTVGSIVGSCGDREKFETRYEAEMRADSLERLGKLARAESFDAQGQLIPLPSNIATWLMRLLYPDSACG
jgi:hypothetical protein